jgi:hypothetical protein
MSTNRSVGRSTATDERVRSASTQAKVRFTFKPKKDRSPNLCAFTFADGRQCRTPRRPGHLHLCYFHAQKEAESLAAQQVGQDISRFLPTKLLTACDLGVAMSRLFCAVAQGQVKSKVASTLAYLAQTMLQSIPIAQDEYIHSFDTDTWRSAVRASFRYEDEPNTSASQAAQPAATPPGCHSERSEEPASSSNSPLTNRHSPPPQPAPKPHTPLPPTSAEFAQQLLARLNSFRPELPTKSESPASSAPSSTSTSTSQTQRTPALQPKSATPPATPVEAGLQAGSSGSSPSPAPSSAPSSPDSAQAHTSSTQPAPSSPCTPPTPNNSQTAPTSSTPPPVPPGLGAPANWDTLILPKPQRRFSRHWQLE